METTKQVILVNSDSQIFYLASLLNLLQTVVPYLISYFLVTYTNSTYYL